MTTIPRAYDTRKALPVYIMGESITNLGQLRVLVQPVYVNELGNPITEDEPYIDYDCGKLVPRCHNPNGFEINVRVLEDGTLYR